MSSACVCLGMWVFELIKSRSAEDTLWCETSRFQCQHYTTTHTHTHTHLTSGSLSVLHLSLITPIELSSQLLQRLTWRQLVETWTQKWHRVTKGHWLAVLELSVTSHGSLVDENCPEIFTLLYQHEQEVLRVLKTEVYRSVTAVSDDEDHRMIKRSRTATQWTWQQEHLVTSWSKDQLLTLKLLNGLFHICFWYYRF